MNDRSNSNNALQDHESMYDGNINQRRTGRANSDSNELDSNRASSGENTWKGYNHEDFDRKDSSQTYNDNREKPPPTSTPITITHEGMIDSKPRERDSRFTRTIAGDENVIARSTSSTVVTTATSGGGDGITTTVDFAKSQERERNRQLLTAKVVQRKPPPPARSGSYASSGSSSYYTETATDNDDDIKPSSRDRKDRMTFGEVDHMLAAKSHERAQSVASLATAKPRAKVSPILFNRTNTKDTPSNDRVYASKNPPSEEVQSYQTARTSNNIDRETGVDAMAQSKQRERQRSMEALMGSNVVKRRSAGKGSSEDPTGKRDPNNMANQHQAQLNDFKSANTNSGKVHEKEQPRRTLRKDAERSKSWRSLETIEEDDMKTSAAVSARAASSVTASIDHKPSATDHTDEMMLSKIRERENRLRSMNQQQRKLSPDQRVNVRSNSNLASAANMDPRDPVSSQNFTSPTAILGASGNDDAVTGTSIRSMIQRRQQILLTTRPNVELKSESSYGTKTGTSAHENDDSNSFDYCLAVARSQSRNVSQTLRDRIYRERAKLGELDDTPASGAPSTVTQTPSLYRSNSTDSDESNDILTLLKQTQALDQRSYSTARRNDTRETILDMEIMSNDTSVGPVREPTTFGNDRFVQDDTAEAQVDVPILFPGAFAIEGVGARDDDSSDSSYDSVFNEQNRNSQYRSQDALDSQLEENSPFADGDETVDNGALAAELHDEIVVDGAVIQPVDDDDIILDIKTVRRLRQVQVSVICFCLAAIAVISISIMGGFQNFSNASDDHPFVQGWQSLGMETFGQTEMAQTLFGYRVVLSGDGSRIAVASPGYDDGSILNAGKLYIMEETAGPNGTEWALLDSKDGVLSSNLPHMSLATSTDFGTVAVGYPHIQGGGQVQIFRESDGSGMWISDPIALNSTTGGETWFGYSVDLSADGSLLAVGDPLQNTGSIRKAGALYVYTKNSSAQSGWSPIGEPIFGKQNSEYFGWSVKIVRAENVTRIIAGAPIANDTTGLVRIYDLVRSKWKQVGIDYVGQEPFQRFGESISASSDGRTFAVGARGTAFSPGNVHIYGFDNATSTTSSEQIIVGTEPGEGFGNSIAMSEDGKVLIVGAPESNLYDRGTGTVRVYRLDETSTSQWIEQGRNIGSATMLDFGTSVSMSKDGMRIVGGAPSTSYAESVPLVGCFQVYAMEQTSAV